MFCVVRAPLIFPCSVFVSYYYISRYLLLLLHYLSVLHYLRIPTYSLKLWKQTCRYFFFFFLSNKEIFSPFALCIYFYKMLLCHVQYTLMTLYFWYRYFLTCTSCWEQIDYLCTHWSLHILYMIHLACLVETIYSHPNRKSS